MIENLDDPMHIYNVRARRAADAAERDMLRAIQREIDGPPQTVMGMLRRALDVPEGADSRQRAAGEDGGEE